MTGEPIGPGDGTTTAFTTGSLYTGEVVTVDRLLQTPGVDYSYAANSLVFTIAPVPGAAIYIRGTTSVAAAGVASGAFDYSADNLLQSIRDIIYAGTSNRDWDDVKLLRLVNRQIQEYLLPFIIRTRKEDFITFADQLLVAGTPAYRLPSKATAARVRALQLVDALGNSYSRLIEIPLEKAILINGNGLAGPVPLGLPQGYYFRGNQVVLVPTPDGQQGLSLRTYYAARPSTLGLKAGFVQITSFPGGAAAGFFRVGIGGVVPSAYGANISCDLVQNQPGFDVLFSGNINAITAGSYVEFAGTLPIGISIGDWVCLAGTAPVVTAAAAEVTVGCLINKVAIEALASKSDDDGFKRRVELLKKSEEEAKSLLNPNRNAGDRPKAGVGSLYRFRRGGFAQ